MLSKRDKEKIFYGKNEDFENFKIPEIKLKVPEIKIEIGDYTQYRMVAVVAIISVVIVTMFYANKSNQSTNVKTQENVVNNSKEVKTVNNIPETTESKDSFVSKTLPKKFLEDKQIPNSELLYTIKWDLFNLYNFQQLSPSERINEFEDDNRMYTISDMLIGFVDKNQQYQIAKNYCIGQDGNVLKKVPCNNPLSINDLPYKKCEWFRIGNSNKYYAYDLKSLWSEFKTKGIEKIEQEIEKETSSILNKETETKKKETNKTTQDNQKPKQTTTTVKTENKKTEDTPKKEVKKIPQNVYSSPSEYLSAVKRMLQIEEDNTVGKYSVDGTILKSGDNLKIIKNEWNGEKMYDILMGARVPNYYDSNGNIMPIIVKFQGHSVESVRFQ